MQYCPEINQDSKQTNKTNHGNVWNESNQRYPREKNHGASNVVHVSGVLRKRKKTKQQNIGEQNGTIKLMKNEKNH